MDITLEQAENAVAAARRKATDLRLKMNIAVVDGGCHLKAFGRMDGAWIGSVDISIRKARTARFFDMPTGEIGKLSQPGGSLYKRTTSRKATLPVGSRKISLEAMSPA